MDIVTKEWNTDVVTWEEIIANYNDSVKKAVDGPIPVKIKMPGYFVVHEANLIDRVGKRLEELDLTDAHGYFNITEYGETLGRHKDTVDVYHWQCIGSTQWEVEGYGTYVLEPGDLIKVPAKVYHEVVPLSPRLGISMNKRYVKGDKWGPNPWEDKEHILEEMKTNLDGLRSSRKNMLMELYQTDHSISNLRRKINEFIELNELSYEW